jgi:hypothetical protein
LAKTSKVSRLSKKMNIHSLERKVDVHKDIPFNVGTIFLSSGAKACPA